MFLVSRAEKNKLNIEKKSHTKKIFSYFLDFLSDFFIWVIAFWLTGMTAGLLIFIEYIPNTNPPLFSVLLNLYIGFFIPLEMLKIWLRKNHIKKLAP